LDTSTFHQNLHSLSSNVSRLLALPNESHSDQPIFVQNHQYAQILKRREQRKNDKRMRVKSKHKSRQLHAARRVRGQGGRFLTKEEKQKLKATN